MNLFSAKKKKLLIKCKYFNEKLPKTHNNRVLEALRQVFLDLRYLTCVRYDTLLTLSF